MSEKHWCRVPRLLVTKASTALREDPSTFRLGHALSLCLDDEPNLHRANWLGPYIPLSEKGTEMARRLIAEESRQSD